MLPPFVPPSARVASENLPLITEFVVNHVEHPFGNSFSVSDSAEGGVATLPSIDEFVMQTAAQGQDEKRAETAEDEQFIRGTSRGPPGSYEARHDVSGEAEAAQPAPVAATLEPDLLLDRRAPLPGSEDAILNEVAEPVTAWAASAAPTVAEMTGSGAEAPASSGSSEPESSTTSAAEPAGTPTVAPEVWVEEERDAFDWQAAANLAVPPAEAQRAADEWSSTEWDRSNGSVQDHVAAMLVHVSRRVRAGDLEVHGSKQMGSEAALVAALSALLAEATKK